NTLAPWRGAHVPGCTVPAGSHLFALFEQQRDGADGELQPHPQLHRKLAGVVGHPNIEVAVAIVQDVVEEEQLVANGLECAGRSPDLLPLLRLDTGAGGFLAVADRDVDRLSG